MAPRKSNGPFPGAENIPGRDEVVFAVRSENRERVDLTTRRDRRDVDAATLLLREEAERGREKDQLVLSLSLSPFLGAAKDKSRGRATAKKLTG